MILLEREGELATVDAVVRRGGVVVVEGGAGIGKTSLIRAACDRAVSAGCDVLRARGSELEEGFAFGVVRQLFERRVAAATGTEGDLLFAGAAAAARPLLLDRLDDVAAPDTSFTVLHGLYWLAVNLAAVRPLVIAVDDAHWADASSLHWLAYLTPRVDGLPLSLVVGLRPAESAADSRFLLAVREEATMVRPELLSRDAVAEIVRTTVGTAPTEELCDAVWRESGGNPFYLHELLRTREPGSRADVDAASLLAHGRADLARHVAARVRRLAPEALQLAQALALFGDGCELRHAAALAETDAATAARLASGLVRLEVLAGDNPPQFLHPVVREAVEASATGDARDAGHLAAARLLHADGDSPERIAAHLVRVRPAGATWVVERLREAARAAVESGAPRAAADLLGRALAEPPPPTERVAVLRELARAEALTGSEAACRRLEEALGLTADALDRAAVGLQLAQAHATLYRWIEAVNVCERALADLGERDDDLAARLEAVLAACGARSAHGFGRVLPVLDRLNRRRLDGAAAEGYAAARALVALLLEGRPAQEIATLLADALRRAGPKAEDWDLRLPVVVSLIHVEGFAEVEAALDGMLTQARRSGSSRALLTSYAALALLKLQLGLLAEADSAARVCLRIFEDGDFGRGLPLVATVLTEVATETGDLEQAEKALSRLPAPPLQPAVNTLRIPDARGRLRLAQNRPAEALAEFEACLALCSKEVWGQRILDSRLVQARSGAAQALMLLGEDERARVLADEAVAELRAFAAPRALGASLRVAGLTRRGEGLALLEESVAVLRTSPAMLERAYSLAELGAALRRIGRRSDAREPLAEALDLAARCGARPLAERAREELRATGARPRREWRTGIEALTPSELRVATLAAEGRTNREIAQALYVTLKTVEGHLARAYEKLDIEGRAQLPRGLRGEKTRVPTP